MFSVSDHNDQRHRNKLPEEETFEVALTPNRETMSHNYNI